MGSHLDQLIQTRRSFTGEHPKDAREQISNTHGGETSQHFRMLPPAHSRDQEILDTSLLLAVRNSFPGWDDSCRDFRVFRSVSPRSDVLMIDLTDYAVAHYIRALLPPIEPSDSGDGVPGIRFRPGRRHTEVRLLGEGSRLTDAVAVLRGVGIARWNRIWETIQRDQASRDPIIDPLLRHSPRMSRGEKEGLEFQRWACGPVSLGSAFLRRIGLMSSAYGFDTWTGNGARFLHIEIFDGPSVPMVMDKLRDPIFGLVDERFHPGTLPYPDPTSGFDRVLDTGAPTSSRSPEPAALVFRELRGLADQKVSAAAVRGEA